MDYLLQYFCMVNSQWQLSETVIWKFFFLFSFSYASNASLYSWTTADLKISQIMKTNIFIFLPFSNDMIYYWKTLSWFCFCQCRSLFLSNSVSLLHSFLSYAYRARVFNVSNPLVFPASLATNFIYAVTQQSRPLVVIHSWTFITIKYWFYFTGDCFWPALGGPLWW